MLSFSNIAVILPAKQAAVTTSSSSEDEEGRGGTTVVRRRRLRKNTVSVLTEPEDEELDLSQQEEEEEEEEAGQMQKQRNVKAPSGVQNVKQRGSSILNKCIMVALIVAISMGFGHFHGESCTDVINTIALQRCTVSESELGCHVFVVLIFSAGVRAYLSPEQFICLHLELSLFSL